MKKALLLLSFVHLLAACTNDIEILPNDASQKLIVNALINANIALCLLLFGRAHPSCRFHHGICASFSAGALMLSSESFQMCIRDRCKGK